MRHNIMRFISEALAPSEINGKRILEIGSADVNGSPRTVVMPHKPAQYIGIDIVPGPSVDHVLNVEHAIDFFGRRSFDVVLCVEVLEHVESWKACVQAIKLLVKKRGIIVITTRSPGYPYHPHPIDKWRYTASDFQVIFGDYQIERLEIDTIHPGVFMKAICPVHVRPPLPSPNVAKVRR